MALDRRSRQSRVDAPVGTPGRLGHLVPAVALALALLAGCSDGQDPGLAPGGERPESTSNTLGQCPPDGPDATTPAAGCIDAGGQVRRP